MQGDAGLDSSVVSDANDDVIDDIIVGDGVVAGDEWHPDGADGSGRTLEQAAPPPCALAWRHPKRRKVRAGQMSFKALCATKYSTLEAEASK